MQLKHRDHHDRARLIIKKVKQRRSFFPLKRCFNALRNVKSFLKINLSFFSSDNNLECAKNGYLKIRTSTCDQKGHC